MEPMGRVFKEGSHEASVSVVQGLLGGTYTWGYILGQLYFVTHTRGLRTPLIATHEPRSRCSIKGSGALLWHSRALRASTACRGLVF